MLDSELFNLDSTICDWIIPRLKRFKEITTSYPGTEELPTFEDWINTIDKMIKGFEMARLDPVEELNLFDDNFKLRVDKETFNEKILEWNKERDECLQLFSKYFNHLWI